MNMNPTLVTATQAVIVAVIVLAGQVVVARLSKRAQQEATEVEAQAKATDAWQKYAQEMKARMDSLEKRLEEAVIREADNRKRIAALERQSEQDRDLIRRLLVRLRGALAEVKTLGGSVNDADLEVADLADARLAFIDSHQE